MTSLFRRPRDAQRAQQAMIVTTPLRREQESAVAATSEQIDAAISGDLIAASPELAAKISEIEGRLDTLEP